MVCKSQRLSPESVRSKRIEQDKESGQSQSFLLSAPNSPLVPSWALLTKSGAGDLSGKSREIQGVERVW